MESIIKNKKNEINKRDGIMLYLVSLPLNHMSYVTLKGTINKLDSELFNAGGGGIRPTSLLLSLKREKLSWPSMHLHSKHHKIPKTAGCKNTPNLSNDLAVLTWSPASLLPSMFRPHCSEGESEVNRPSG